MQTQLNLAAHSDNSRRARIGIVQIDFATHAVTRAGSEMLRLSPKAAHVLSVLVAHKDRPVHRDVLFTTVWPGQFRTDDVITKVMQELRRALADSSDLPVIETIPRVGYRLKVAVQWLDDSSAPSLQLNASGPITNDVQLQHDDPKATNASVNVLATRRRRGKQIFAWLCAAAVVSALSVLLLYKTLAVSPSGKNAASTKSNWLANATLTPRVRVTPFSTSPGDELFSAISPDGTLVAISTRSVGDTRFRLRLRSVADGVDRLLVANTAGDELAPIFSPDGTRIAYFRHAASACTIEIADVFGIAHRVLAGCESGPTMAIEFFPDGKAILVPWMALSGLQRRIGFARIDLESGTQSDFHYAAIASDFELEARFSPDGKKLLVQRGAAPFSSLVLYHLGVQRDAAPIKLGERFSAIHGFTWLPDSRHVVLASDSAGAMGLWRLDTTTAAIESFSGILGEFPSAARASDALTFVRNERASSLNLLQLQARPEGDTAKHARIAHSPEKRGLLYAMQRREIFASTRSEGSPALTTDGTQIAFVSDRGGSAQIYVAQLTLPGAHGEQSLDASQAVRMTQLQSGLPMELSFSADAKQLAFSVRDGLEFSAWIMDLTTRKLVVPKLLRERAIDLRFGAQPGQLLFAARDQPGKIHVYSQQDNASVRQISSCQGRAPRDGGDGYIYFFAPDARALKRVRADAIGAACELVSDRVRWLNRSAWVADSAGVVAVLSRLDRVQQAGVYRLSEPPQLLLALPELSRRPVGKVELVAATNGALVMALPAAQNGDVWLVRGLGSGDL